MRHSKARVLGALGVAALAGCNQILGIEEHDLAPAAGMGGTSQAGTGNLGGSAGAGLGGTSGGGGTAGMEQTAGVGADGGTSGTAGGTGCGDGTRKASEECDDGNTKAGDGCSGTCTIEDGWTCDSSGCEAICGDEFVVGAEAKAGGCDDNNVKDNDGCTDCRVDDEYVCSGAPSVCARTCGDGKLDDGEECDDDNTRAGDGCYACHVETGYDCDTTEEPTSCTDIDECATGDDDCDTHADCDNKDGGWDCTCKSGYEGTGQDCAAVDECEGTTNCDENATCDDTPAAPYTCTCNPGYTGTGQTCARISCDGLGKICGPSSNEDCCAAPEVTGGTFYRSYTDPATYDFPADVTTFHLDRFEVTVGRFRKFVDAWNGGWRPAAGDGKHQYLNAGKGLIDVGVPTQPAYESGWNLAWEGDVDLVDMYLTCYADGSGTWADDGSMDDYPMNCINWFESYAFCIWDGGFLPSEAEWAYAATGGSDQRVYPWLSGFLDCGHANGYFGTTPCVERPGGYPWAYPVGTNSTAGDGKYGQADMSGNLQEWVLDWNYSYKTPCEDCAWLTGDPFRITRGGSFNSDATGLQAQTRNLDNPSNRGAHGARCARP